MAGSLIRAYYAVYFGAVAFVMFDDYPLDVPAPEAWPWLFLACSFLALASLVKPSRTMIAWALAFPAGLGVCRAMSILMTTTDIPLDRRLVGSGLWLFPLVLALDSESR